MPTITLTIDDATLERLRAGENTLTLTATVRERKPKHAPLPDDLKPAFQEVSDLWVKYQRTPPSLMWKAMRVLLEGLAPDARALAVDAYGLWLEWNDGRKLMPAWFAKEREQWEDRVLLDLFDQDDARTAYRRQFRLPV